MIDGAGEETVGSDSEVAGIQGNARDAVNNGGVVSQPWVGAVQLAVVVGIVVEVYGGEITIAVGDVRGDERGSLPCRDRVWRGGEGADQRFAGKQL